MSRVGPALVGALVTATLVGGAVDAGASGTWLDAVNAYRAAAALPGVTENSTYSSGDLQHATYLVENNTTGHSEDPSKPYYTPTGAAAGQASNVMAASNIGTTDTEAVDLWMTGPFHAVGIIDPSLATVGFGSFRAQMPGEEMAAALNVINGRTTAATSGLPVAWPGKGTTTALRSYGGGESPDPLTSCPGYSAPTGAPIILETGVVAAVVGGYGLSSAGHPVAVCELDGANYSNPDSNTQAEGRAVLAARGAVVLMPRSPLAAGTAYTVNITANSTAYTWSFNTKSAGLPTPATSLARPHAAAAPHPRPVTRPAAPRPVVKPVAQTVTASPAEVPDVPDTESGPQTQLNAPAALPLPPLAQPGHALPWWWLAVLVALLGGTAAAFLARRRRHA